MHFDFLSLLSPIVLGGAVALGHWIGGRYTSPKDHERAAILSSIAEGAAALVVSLQPKASWSELLKATVAAISSAAGLPTKSAGAIERAAASALVKLGRSGS